MPEPLEALARAALAEITPPASVGDHLETVDEGDGVVSLLFAPTMLGYPGWRWTVSIAQLEGAEPTVLEAELMPAEGALLAPDWVPWADRLAEYKAQQEALGLSAETDEESAEGEDDEEDDDDLDDVDPDDDDEPEDDLDDHVLDDDDVLGSDVLHAGDLDGVDIDEHDDESEDESGDDDESDDDEGDSEEE